MAPVKNARVLFVESPGIGMVCKIWIPTQLTVFGFTDLPQPGKHTTYDSSQTIDLEAVPLNGGILLKTLVLSIDPYIKGLMLRVRMILHLPCGYPCSQQNTRVLTRKAHRTFPVSIYTITNFLPLIAFQNLHIRCIRRPTNRKRSRQSW